MKRVLMSVAAATAVAAGALAPATTASAAAEPAPSAQVGASAKGAPSLPCWVQGVAPRVVRGKVQARENVWCTPGASQVFERVQLQKLVAGSWRNVAAKQGYCYDLSSNQKCYTLAATWYAPGTYRTVAYGKVWLYDGRIGTGTHTSPAVRL
ncbi:MAG: hypothetical protein V9G19_16630 [Tetrasphaera sp.]